MAGKKKKNLTLIYGLIALVVLAGVYVLVRGMGGEEETEEAADVSEETIELAAIDPEEVTSISFRSGQEELILIKEDGTWYYEADPEFPILQSQVETMLSALETVEATRKLDDAEELSEYGLENPVNQIVASGEEGELGTFYIGNINSSTTEYYLMTEREGDIYTVGTTLPSAFEKDLYDLVEADEIPGFDSADVANLVVEEGENSMEFSSYVENSATNWTIRENEEEQRNADSSKVTELLEGLSGLGFDSCVEYRAENLENYGLDDPALILHVDYRELVETEESEEEEEDDDESEDEYIDKQFKLFIGDRFTVQEEEEEAEDQEEELDLLEEEIVEDEPEEFVYAMLEGSTQVLTIKAEDIDVLIGLQTDVYLDTAITSANINDLEMLKVSYDGEEYELYREEEVEVTENEDGEKEESTTYKYYVNQEEVESSTFTNFFYTANSMQAESYTEESIDEDEAEITLTFQLKDGSEIIAAYVPYDQNFYIVEKEDKYALVNKMDVSLLVNSLLTLRGDE